MTEERYEYEYEYAEETNKCPKCGSDRISICKGIEISVEKNLKTGKTLKRDKMGSTKFWLYKCRKCGWISETCTEAGIYSNK